MARYSKFKTVIDGDEQTYRSENATYTALCDWAAQQEDGAVADVFVQEGGDSWYPFAYHVARGGFLDER